MAKKYRDNGAIGALLDEYEKSVNELKDTIVNLSSSELARVIDKETKDADCRSIQTILSHVIGAGYNYVVEIRKSLGEDIDHVTKITLGSIKEYILALDKMFAYNEKLFQDYPKIRLEEFISEKKFKVSWGQTYDVEQLYEHAIVHILRHRRQIERFKLKL